MNAIQIKGTLSTVINSVMVQIPFDGLVDSLHHDNGNVVLGGISYPNSIIEIDSAIVVATDNPIRLHFAGSAISTETVDTLLLAAILLETEEAVASMSRHRDRDRDRSCRDRRDQLYRRDRDEPLDSHLIRRGYDLTTDDVATIVKYAVGVTSDEDRRDYVNTVANIIGKIICETSNDRHNVSPSVDTSLDFSEFVAPKVDEETATKVQNLCVSFIKWCVGLKFEIANDTTDFINNEVQLPSQYNSVFNDAVMYFKVSDCLETITDDTYDLFLSRINAARSEIAGYSWVGVGCVGIAELATKVLSGQE